MTKIRITFVLLAFALLLPVALLVRGALQSVGKERELRHQAIAERIFDEMERELTTFLRREEERGVEQYARLASGRVDEVPEPFIEGYFQVLTDGSVDAWPESSRSEAVDFVKSLSREGNLGQMAERDRRRAAIQQQALTQRPGTTVPLKLEDQKRNVALHEDRNESASDAFYSAESVLRQLNRGAYARKTRDASQSMDLPTKDLSTEEGRAGETFGDASREASVYELSADKEQQGLEKRAGARSAGRLVETADGRGVVFVPPMTARLQPNSDSMASKIAPEP